MVELVELLSVPGFFIVEYIHNRKEGQLLLDVGRTADTLALASELVQAHHGSLLSLRAISASLQPHLLASPAAPTPAPAGQPALALVPVVG